MNYFDLHCDTATKMFFENGKLFNNNFSVSLKKFSGYEQKGAIFAICSENIKSEQECFTDFINIATNLVNEINENSETAEFCTNSKQLKENKQKFKIILSAESSRLIGHDLDKLRYLYSLGLRVINPAWKGVCDTCGAYDTDVGFSNFGKEFIAECEKLGIIIDVSHLSQKAFYDLTAIAKKPFFASHSNSDFVYHHARNLTDTQIKTITEKCGVIGVNLVAKHLYSTFKKNPNKNDALLAIYSHINHFLEKGFEKSLCLGLDFDGTAPIFDLDNVSKVKDIYNFLEQKGIKDKKIYDIFYNNAFNFLYNML